MKSHFQDAFRASELIFLSSGESRRTDVLNILPTGQPGE
jgi:hypothetical protein